jgi:hypothetical protein
MAGGARGLEGSKKLGLTVKGAAGFLLVFSNANLSISHVYRDQDA